MPKKRGKKKDKVIEGDWDVEVMPIMEIIYEDTKVVIGHDQEFYWGQIYHMIKDQNVPDAVLKDIPLYENIIKSGITKAAMPLELFPYDEVI